MTSKLPDSGSAQKVFLQGLTGVLSVLQKVFLPHLAAGMGIFLMAAYASYAVWLEPARLPSVLEFVLACLLFGVYGAVAFVYSLLAACVFALRCACAALEDFIDDMLDLVKESVSARVENMNESLLKDQAKLLVSGGVKDVFGGLGGQNLKSFPRVLAAGLLGAVTLAMRSVLLARIAKISGTTVHLGKLFAGRASLAGAVFLNLRLVSSLLLGLVYGVGAAAVLLNFFLVFRWR